MLPRGLLALLALSSLAAPTWAQVSDHPGPSPNLTGLGLNFDAPFIPLGPVAPGQFVGYGFAAVERVGAQWAPSGAGTLSYPDWTGRGLGSNHAQLAVVNNIATTQDRPGPGDGWRLTLVAPVDELEFSFSGAIDFVFEVELSLGGVSLGVGSFLYPSPRGSRYVRASGSKFDEVRITFPAGAPVVALDNLRMGDGPPPQPPANDECAARTLVAPGPTPFSTYHATPSSEPWSCGNPDGGDVWFEYRGVNPGWELTLDLCQAPYDTTLEVYTDDCGAPHLVACNDDACGARSRVRIPGVVRDRPYIIRVGGYRYANQHGVLRVVEAPPALPIACIETYFVSDGGAAPGGVVFFDLDAREGASVAALELNTSTVGPVGLRVFVRPGGHVGHTCAGCTAGWTLAAEDDGASVGLGVDQRTVVRLAQPWSIPPGLLGVALVGSNPATGGALAHRFTDATGFGLGFASADGLLAFTAGSAADAPWSGAAPVPAIWNGRLCGADPALGTNACAANPNASGQPGRTSWSGSTSVAANDLVLLGLDLPWNSFAFFLTSRDRGYFPNAGNSFGNLCLAGAIGRFVGPGQIQHSGTLGAVSLAIDLTRHPTPGGFIAVQPGDTWYFTLWFRDPVGGLPYSNFTDRLRLQFQ